MARRDALWDIDRLFTMEEKMRYSPIVLALFAIASQAQDAPIDRNSYCSNIANFAERAMQNRQAGLPPGSQINNIRLYFTTDAEREAANALVESAWKKKQASTPRRQQIQTNRFRDNAEEYCLKGKIFP